MRKLACSLFLLTALFPAPSFAQRRFKPPPNYVQFGKPDQSKGRQILEKSRRYGISGNYYLTFELQIRPHDLDVDETVLYGRQFGTRNVTGPLTRVAIAPSRKALASNAPGSIRLLLQSGSHPRAWEWKPGEKQAEPLSRHGVMKPLAGSTVTPFDLEMPFMYWDDFVYEGITRFRDRPTHVFLLYPPETEKKRYPGISGVRIYVDTQFDALIQWEDLGTSGDKTKTISILDFKKVGKQWLIKSIDVRDEITRNKTRLRFTNAALNASVPPSVFDPSSLAQPVAARELPATKPID